MGFGAQSSTCSKEGDCGCNAGTSDVCTVDCITGTDACKDGTIRCNNDGFDCIVNCMSESSCSGSTTIIGPVGGRLTVNCHGLKSCEGATVFDGAQSTDMTVICLGNEACKGSVTLNFGTGEGRLECHGTPDSCVGSLFLTCRLDQMLPFLVEESTVHQMHPLPLEILEIGQLIHRLQRNRINRLQQIHSHRIQEIIQPFQQILVRQILVQRIREMWSNLIL